MHLGERPDVELALDALGVGVERGGEAALLLAQLGERPVERLAAHALEQRLARDLPRVQVGAGQQRVVVEHLLEVRDEPGAVDRVAREAAADLVVHAAAGHPRAACAAPSRARRGRAGSRSPRRAGTSARRRSRRARRRRACAGRRRRRRASAGSISASGGFSAAAPRSRGTIAPACERISSRCSSHAAPIAVQHLRPARHALARLGREVRAGPERDAVGGEERVQRPAALPGHRLHGVHVDRVDVRALLAVDLDADEALVHQLRDRARPRRTRAPSRGTSGRRSSRSRRASARSSSRARRERLLAPRVPVDGVLGVLEQVGGGLAARRLAMRLGSCPCPIIAKP